jgi:hypothetical protein
VQIARRNWPKPKGKGNIDIDTPAPGCVSNLNGEMPFGV